MSAEVSLHRLSGMSPAGRARLLDRAETDLSDFIERARPIVDAVRDEGDDALVRFAEAFDKAVIPPEGLRVSEAEFEAAQTGIPAELRATLEFCADNIRRFHAAQAPRTMWMSEMHPGVLAGERHTPIDGVACYVPRGKGAFPSVALMTAIPAVVAGVESPIIVTPPGPDGRIDAATLVAARIAGVRDVFRCGGAQAVAAVAYGTESVPRCVKIVGPGSPWVAAAKRLVVDHLDPGPPAGPSESVVLCDDAANGALAALDLIVESEHGPDSSAFLVTSSERVAREAMAAIPGYWARMGERRRGYSAAVLTGERGGVVLAEGFEDAIEFVNDYAPEHLEILSAEPFETMGRIRNAGEILLGEHSAIPLGNFALGPNAVLPTAMKAKSCGPLSVFDFLKRSSFGHVSRAGYERLAPHAERFAAYEGFDGHANAVSATRMAARERR